MLKGLRRVETDAEDCGGFGGDEGGTSSSTTVALPSREVVRRIFDDERRSKRGGGKVRAEVRRGLTEVEGSGGKTSSSDATEPFNTSCKRLWAEAVIFASGVLMIFDAVVEEVIVVEDCFMVDVYVYADVS